MRSFKNEIASISTAATYEIPVRGSRILLTRKNIPLKYLGLDPTNQRIQFILKSEKIMATDDAIDERMWKEDYVKDLSYSIDTNEGLLCPILVTVDGIVVEGNSRLVALRHIKIRYEGTGKKIPVYILYPPCEILPEKISRTELLWLLAEFHVSGKHRWDAYEQAETIYNLYHKEKQSKEIIAKHLRIQRQTVERKLSSYSLMNEYLQKYEEKGQIQKWSYFDELYKKPGLFNRLNPDTHEYDPNFKGKFFSWVHDEKIKGEEVRKLEPILEDSNAFRIFEKSGLKDASIYLAQQEEEENYPFFTQITEVIEQIDHMSEENFEKLFLSGIYEHKVKLLHDLSDKLEWLTHAIDVKKRAEEEVAIG